jgi:drug/metabolite transporter (DMT)-like permease
MRSRTSHPFGPARAATGRSAFDGLLVLMVLIWGANYSVIKRAFEEVPPQSFNAVRLAIASVVYLTAIVIARRRARLGRRPVSPVFHTPHALTRADRWSLLWVGLVGHLCYQACFAAGVNGTSVSNAALIISTTPTLVAVASALLGHGRISPFHWIGSMAICWSWRRCAAGRRTRSARPG